MEALALKKSLVVVVNAALMDDHQQELARVMEEQVRACRRVLGLTFFDQCIRLID